jgi:hypothetical protein
MKLNTGGDDPRLTSFLGTFCHMTSNKLKEFKPHYHDKYSHGQYCEQRRKGQ